MPGILHRISIDASQDRLHDMLATRAGLEQWWSGHPVGGDDRVGGKLAFYFGGPDPSAVMEVLADTPNQIASRCHEGPPTGSTRRSPSTSSPPARTTAQPWSSATPAGRRRRSS